VIGLDDNNMSNFVPPGTHIPGVNGTHTVDEKNWVHTNGDHNPGAFSYLAVFAGAAIFAIGDAVWESVLPATIQAYFMDDGDKAVNASNANYKMWQSLGFAAQFAIGATFPSLDTNETVLQHFHLKVLILAALLIVGGGGVAIVTSRYPIDKASKEDALLEDTDA